MTEKIKENRLKMLNNRLTIVTERIEKQQAKETPNADRISNLTARKAKIQSRIDTLNS